MIDAPPARRVLVGIALRRYREDLGYQLDDAARLLECDRSKISRIETGQRGIRPKELRELLTEYGVSTQEQNALTTLAKITHGQDSSWQQHSSVIPAPAQEYLALVQAASDISIYAPQHLPDLLQTPQYAQAAATADPAVTTRQAPAEHVTACQQALSLRQPSVTAVVGETALNHPGVPPEISRNQLTVLIAGPAVIQILPAGHGMPSAGPATILRFAGLPALGAVYLPALSGGVCLISQSDVAAYTSAFEHLRAAAWPAAESAHFIQSLAGGRTEPSDG